MNQKLNFQKLLDKYAEGVATQEERRAIVEMIEWITSETTRRGSRPRATLSRIADIVENEDYLKVDFVPCLCFYRLFYNMDTEKVEYQTAQHGPEERRAMKEYLLKSSIRQVEKVSRH